MCGEHVLHHSTGDHRSSSDAIVGTAINTCRNISSEPNPAVLKQIIIDNKDICLSS
jgi:hypothetical protein